TLEHLDAAAIERMNAQARELESALAAAAAEHDVPLTLTRAGSVIGPHFSAPEPSLDKSTEDEDALALFHLAALNAGVFFTPNDGVMSMSTALSDEAFEEATEALCAAVAVVAATPVRQEA